MNTSYRSVGLRSLKTALLPHTETFKFSSLEKRSKIWRYLRIATVLVVVLLTFAVSSTLAGPFQQPSPQCQNPATVSIIVLDTTPDGLFIRTDANGNPLSRPFGSTEVWITGDLEGQVTVRLSPSAADALKDNDSLSFINRTDNEICINLNLSPAIGELSSDVFLIETSLQIGDSNGRPILIDLSSFDTLTILDQTFENDELTAEDITNAILSAQDELPSVCDSITSDLDTEALRAVLNAIAIQGHTALTYTPGVREALRNVDLDPNNPDNVILIYTNRSQDRFSFESDDTSIEFNERWNREHLWPQSHGAGLHDVPKTDLHHIYPADRTVNSSRSNEDFGEVPETPANRVTDGPNNQAIPGTFDDQTFWEPRDEIKGDIARALFYMDIRYEGQNGEPDLVLIEGDSPDTDRQTELGDLAALLKWHTQDPVSVEETTRHAKVVEFQGNTNPFITCANQIDVTRIWPPD
jgi:serine protease